MRDAGGALAEISATKPGRLLAELVLHRGDWVETGVLVEALWEGETQPASARGNLKTYVHQLRQALPPAPDGSPRLESRRGAYRLAVTRAECDVTVFDDLVEEGRAALARSAAGDAAATLRRALELWRGRPYAGLGSTEAEAEAARLEELRRVALDGLADALVAASQPGEAVTILNGLTTEEPLREGSWARLLLALRADGRLAEALAAFDRVRRLLDDELGATPGAELGRVYRMLLEETAQSPDPAAPPSSPAPPPPSAPAPRRRGRWRPRILGAVGGLAAVSIVIALAVVIHPGDAKGGRRSGEPAAAAEVSRYPASAAAQRPVPGFPAKSPGLLFGMGDEADTARRAGLVRSGSAGMLTTWYDGPDELRKYQAWRTGLVPGLYRSGKALHLIVGTWPDQGKGSGPVRTPYGRGCGQYYPLTDGFLDDMRTLARSFAGRADGPPLYVSVYDSIEKLACSPGGYFDGDLNTTYYRAVRDRYLKTVKIFHRYAPNARVGLNWDGWEATDTDPEHGNGRALITHFAREVRASDFVSFSAFEPHRTEHDIRASVAELHKFGLPIMLSYYEPYSTDHPSAQSREFDSDLRSLFTASSMRTLTRQGLFAWSFKRPRLLERSPESRRLATDAVKKYGRSWRGT